MRINKYLASCGLGSRRKCEQMVLDGRVSVNGKTIGSLSFDVLEKMQVCVDGNAVGKREFMYAMLFKPKGFVTTKSDEKGRKTVMDLLPKDWQHLNPVGRLDYDTEGLLLLTNDGELANALTHPSREIEKTYIAKVEGTMLESELAVLRSGVVIDGKRTEPAKVRVTKLEKGKTTVELIIHEGRNRQIRKMFEAIGKNVIFLKRVGFGPIALGGLSRGKARLLRDKEVNALMNATAEELL